MELSRRNFLKGTGALAGISAMGAIGLGCSPAANEGTEAKGGKAEAPKTPAETTPTTLKEATDGKFTALCHEVAADYPEITVDDYYIDIMAANLVNERVRGGFQVLLLPNLYGDIITDEAAQLQGGVGTAGSANIGDRHAMFEAIHGSAPRMIERGMGDYANPQSILRAEVMLLRHIGRAAAADRLEAALNACPVVITGEPDGATCADYGDGILKLL